MHITGRQEILIKTCEQLSTAGGIECKSDKCRKITVVGNHSVSNMWRMYDKNEIYVYFITVYNNNKPKLLWYLYAYHFLGVFYKERKQKIHLMWRTCQSV